MDNIEKWLKSLRLHKYSHLFNSLTYDQMLNLEEAFLIEREVTKGARNKMLVSIKKLNLREERLRNMIDDINQDNISIKEALTTLKDMLITPIPMSPPYKLGHLFIETVEKVARRLIESAGMEDNACHGIIASIVDECLKHNSFTKEQKAIVAGFRQHFTKEQKPKVASFKQQSRQHHQNHYQSQQHQQQQQQLLLQHHRPHSHYQHQQQQHHHHQHHYDQSHSHHHQQHKLHHQHIQHIIAYNCNTSNSNSSSGSSSSGISSININNQSHGLSINANQHHNPRHYHCQQLLNLNDCWSRPAQQPSSISASLSTIGSASTSDTEEEQQQQLQLHQQQRQQQQQQQQQRLSYKEYSLLWPGTTFELPSLKAALSSSLR